MMTAYGMLFVGLTVLAVFGGLLVLGLFTVRNLTYSGSGQAPASGGTSQGLEVLIERYARGEITQERHEHTRSDLLM
jgi:uncharacterized membrane protein